MRATAKRLLISRKTAALPRYTCLSRADFRPSHSEIRKEICGRRAKYPPKRGLECARDPVCPDGVDHGQEIGGPGCSLGVPGLCRFLPPRQTSTFPSPSFEANQVSSEENPKA